MSPRCGSAPIGNLILSVDFQRVLATRPRFLSSHFAVHHLTALPSGRHRPVHRSADADLSTGLSAELVDPVDDLRVAAVAATPGEGLASVPLQRLWCGAIVPKRHARRAVTRTLLKRQIRTAAFRHAASMADGLWIVRLRVPFDRTAFPSASSEALRRAARGELEQLLLRCATPLTAGCVPGTPQAQ